MTTLRLLVSLLLILSFSLSVFGQSSEFSGGGFDEMRIENEYKLAVPSEITDSVWQYLLTRYGNNENLFLKQYDPTFSSKVAEDFFVDQYYDNEEMQLLEMQCGVRHRSRFVLTNEKDRKNGRQLMQIKINGIDGNELNRAEYKYEIKYYGKPNKPLDLHPFFYNIRREMREPIANRLKEFNINAFDLFPTIRLEQLRKRVYISLKNEAFATMTLDFVTAHFDEQAVKYVELELELNEINYTLGDSTARAQMEEINSNIKNDLLTTFPSIKQDQTPKYNKGFVKLGLKDFSYRPLLGMTDTNISEFTFLILGLFVLLYHWREKKEKSLKL